MDSAKHGARASLKRLATPVLALELALTLTFASAPPPAEAAKPRLAFAVVAATMRTAADEAPTQRLLQAIALEPQVAFVVYDGNLKGANERCADQLYAQRQETLDSSPLPLVFIPGRYDWNDCGEAQAGGYDVVERLDFLRQSIFSDNTSLGKSKLALKRESDVARFHSYRENVRWQVDDTVFVGLNVVGGNNHYLTAGGRNGEYDDRAIATAFWLEHAAEYARRRQARALVVIIEADPDFQRYERTGRFSWLRLRGTRPRDGYLEFKRALVEAAQTFRGPVIVIHQATTALPRGFSIDQPLFDDKGERMPNVTRIAIGPRERTSQWVRIDVNYGRQAPFLVTTRRIATAGQAPAAPVPREPQNGRSPQVAPSASGIMPAPPQMPGRAPSAPAEPPLLPEDTGASSVPPLPPRQPPADVP